MTATISRLRSSRPAAGKAGGTPAASELRLTRRGRAVLTGVELALLAAVISGVLMLALASGPQPPATGAAALVPGDALAYIHVSTDRGRPEVKQALSIAARFPHFRLLSDSLSGRLTAIASGGSRSDFAGDIRPWLGKEAALALLNTTSSSAGSLIVLDVKRRLLAQAFLARSGAKPDGAYRRTSLLRYRSGTELAFVRHYLALGQPASVRAAIDAASGSSGSLQRNSAYQRAAAGEPADRALDGYISVAGVRRVLGARGGVLGALGALLYQPALSGTAISVSPHSNGFKVRVHSALDPTLARLNGARPGAFSPTLASVMPSGSAMLLEVKDLVRSAPRLLGAGAAGGVAGGLGPLLGRLGSALATEGVNVPGVLSLFRGETAIAISPGSPPPGSPTSSRSTAHSKRSPRAGKPSASAFAGMPALLSLGPWLQAPRTPARAFHPRRSSSAPRRAAGFVIVTRTHDESGTRNLLASLEAPLAQLFPPPANGPGVAPVFNDVEVAGVQAHQLALAPGLQFDYAVFHGLIVISSTLDGIATVVHHARSLKNDPAYEATVGDRPDEVTSLLFLDFSQLLRLGEHIGLLGGGRLAALRPDLNKIRAVGLDSTRGETDTTAELSLKIS